MARHKKRRMRNLLTSCRKARTTSFEEQPVMKSTKVKEELANDTVVQDIRPEIDTDNLDINIESNTSNSTQYTLAELQRLSKNLIKGTVGNRLGYLFHALGDSLECMLEESGMKLIRHNVIPFLFDSGHQTMNLRIEHNRYFLIDRITKNKDGSVTRRRSSVTEEEQITLGDPSEIYYDADDGTSKPLLPLNVGNLEIASTFEVKHVDYQNKKVKVNSLVSDTYFGGLPPLKELVHFGRESIRIMSSKQPIGKDVLPADILNVIGLLLPNTKALFQDVVNYDNVRLHNEHFHIVDEEVVRGHSSDGHGCMIQTVDLTVDLTALEKLYPSFGEMLAHVGRLDSKVLKSSAFPSIDNDGDVAAEDAAFLEFLKQKGKRVPSSTRNSSRVIGEAVDEAPVAQEMSIINHGSECEIRTVMCFKENSSEVIWMTPDQDDPKPLLAHQHDTRYYQKSNAVDPKGFLTVHFDETSTAPSTCMVSQDLTLRIPQLGCKSIALPRVVVEVSHVGNHVVDSSDEGDHEATFTVRPVFFATPRLAAFLLRPFFNLNLARGLTMEYFRMVFHLRQPTRPLIDHTMDFRGSQVGKCFEFLCTMQLMIVPPPFLFTSCLKGFISKQIHDLDLLVFFKDFLYALGRDFNRIMSS